MKRTTIIMLAGLTLMLPNIAQGQAVVGTTATEIRHVTHGWSAERQVLGKPVFNDANQNIGTIDDVIIGPSKTVSYVIIGTGGFLGLAKHDVAVPIFQLKQVNGKFILAGATKEALKSLPPFEYAH